MTPVSRPSIEKGAGLMNFSQLSDFAEQLFPYLEPNRFATFSCGHIVPPDHVGTYAVSKGPTGVLLEFKYDRRGDEKLVTSLARGIRAPLTL